jgi:hypothetical protein
MRKERRARPRIYRAAIGFGSRRGGDTRSTGPLGARIRRGSGHGCGGPRARRRSRVLFLPVSVACRRPPRARGWVTGGPPPARRRFSQSRLLRVGSADLLSWTGRAALRSPRMRVPVPRWRPVGCGGVTSDYAPPLGV